MPLSFKWWWKKSEAFVGTYNIFISIAWLSIKCNELEKAGATCLGRDMTNGKFALNLTVRWKFMAKNAQDKM